MNDTSPPQLLALRGPQMWRIDVSGVSASGAGDDARAVGERIGPPEWRGVQAMAGRNGLGYAVEKGSLMGLYGDTGQYQRLGAAGEWRRTQTMCATPDDVFAIDGDRLYRIDPRNGSFTAIGRPGDWTGDVELAAAGTALVAHWRDHLYVIDPVSGAWRPVDEHTEVQDLSAIAGVEGVVFAAFRGVLWRIALEDGARDQLGDRQWGDDTRLATAAGALFALTDDDLFWVDQTTGEDRRLSQRREWSGTERIAGL